VKLIESLLDAISRLEGDALIMHVGEKPYVVTSSASMYAYRGPVAWGHVELSSRVLTTDAVVGMLEQLLPVDQRKALDEYGAVEYELSPSGPASDGFTVVAARGGDDVWLEIRRTPAVLPDEIAAAPPAPPPVSAIPEPQPAVVAEDAAEPEPFEIVEEEPQLAPTDADVDELLTMSAASLTPAAGSEPEEIEKTVPEQTPAPAPEPLAEQVPEPVSESVPESVPEPVPASRPEPVPEPTAEPAPEPTAEPAPEPVAAGVPELVPELQAVAHPSVELPTIGQAPVEPLKAPEAVEEPAAGVQQPSEAKKVPEPILEEVEPPSPIRAVPPAVVLPLSRSPIAPEPPVEVRSASGTPVERVLRIAAARGAATVYVVARSQPVIRVDGEISVLEGEPSLTAAEIERLVMDLAPARARDAAAPGEWVAEVPDVGRVRCVTFRDHRGPGVIFRMIPPKAISADQLGISPEVQALCAQPDGLVLVTGARASGKSTLLSAFVDLINRTRSDHVITIESQIAFVHESRKSFVSQREVRGNSESAASAVRSAFREDPDVLVIEDLRTPEIVAAALEAAESGRLVFGSVSAVSTVAAIDRLTEMFPPDRRPQAQSSLASALRGVVAQTLLRKVKGGRIAAREVLLNTPAVASLILEGKTFQLPVALASGRRHGMMPLADSMAALVREGTVHAAEAYRKAPDRDALLAALRRDGVDTSFAERLA
jgi:twitching motility protein PilT